MGAPQGVLCPHGVLDAVNLLLVTAAVHHCALLGIPQCSLQAACSPAGGSRLSSISSFWTVSFRVLFFSFSFSYFLFHCSAVSSRLMEAVFLMVLAVDLVSASL
uniref:Uncharacterized protein n=1 Tax=Sander lucioperca TaxID=283035 RepID=A0A8C9XZK9_SANLU